MRNPNRIPGILDDLEHLWNLSPDLRLGQLLCILAKSNDPFFIEDDELRDKIHDLILDMTATQRVA